MSERGASMSVGTSVDRLYRERAELRSREQLPLHALWGTMVAVIEAYFNTVDEFAEDMDRLRNAGFASGLRVELARKLLFGCGRSTLRW